MLRSKGMNFSWWNLVTRIHVFVCASSDSVKDIKVINHFPIFVKLFLSNMTKFHVSNTLFSTTRRISIFDSGNLVGNLYSVLFCLYFIVFLILFIYGFELMKDFMIFLVVFGTSHLYFNRHLEFRTKHGDS